MQMLGKPGKPLLLVQRGVARMQQPARRVIDIHQHTDYRGRTLRKPGDDRAPRDRDVHQRVGAERFHHDQRLDAVREILRDSGAITAEEYEAKKQELLGRL